VAEKLKITLVDFVRAGNKHVRRSGAPKKVAHGGNGGGHFAAMSGNVLARDIGAETLVTVRGAIEDQTRLSALRFIAVFLGAQKHSKFQRHVEARQPRPAVELGPRNIVNADPAFGNDFQDFVYPHLAGIGHFQRASRDAPAIVHGENDGVKQLSIRGVEGTVNEYAEVVFAGHWGEGKLSASGSTHWCLAPCRPGCSAKRREDNRFRAAQPSEWPGRSAVS